MSKRKQYHPKRKQTFSEFLKTKKPKQKRKTCVFSFVDSDGVTRIVMAMPKPMPVACTNPHIRNKVKKACTEIFPVLKEHNAVRNISCYSLSQLEPLKIYQSVDMVYFILTDEGLRAEKGEQTTTSNLLDLIKKIGYTRALKFREYDAETKERIRAMLNSGMISPQLDNFLVDKINFWLPNFFPIRKLLATSSGSWKSIKEVATTLECDVVCISSAMRLRANYTLTNRRRWKRSRTTKNGCVLIDKSSTMSWIFSFP